MAGCRVSGVMSAAAALILSAGMSFGQNTWIVQMLNVSGEADFQLVQLAIDSNLVLSGDTIEVYGPGASLATADPTVPYPELIDLRGKNLKIRGMHTSQRVRIMGAIPDPHNLPLQVVRIAGGQDRTTEFDNFSIETPTISTPDGEITAPVRGMHIGESGPIVRDCLFVDLMADAGAGMLVDTSASPLVTHCVFRNCDTLQEVPTRDISVPLRGGAIYVADADLMVESSTFTGCYAPVCGGAMHVLGASNVMITGSTFSDNETMGLGGAIYTEHDDGYSLDVIESGFYDNQAGQAGGGVAVMSFGPSVFLSCNFEGNHMGDASVLPTVGGGLYHSLIDAGPDPTDPPDDPGVCTIVNSKFYDNSSDIGAAIAAAHPAAVTWVKDTSVGHNTAGNAHAPIYNFAHLTIENSIVYHNSPPVWVEQQFTANPPLAFYSDLQGYNSAVNPGDQGCIDENPRFYYVEDGDFHLLPWSPCIDTGDNARVPADWYDLDGDMDTGEWLPYDFERNQRIFTPNVDPGIVDMGAFEVVEPGPCNIADFATPYGTLDFFDVLEWFDRFSHFHERADVNDDGAFNFFDALAFLQAFSQGCP